MSVLGIDVGTTTCKGVLLSQDGKILAQTFQNYAEKPTIVEDRAEIPAQVFKEGVFSIIKKLSLSAEGDPVEAIALSTHGETLIPIDGDGNPFNINIALPLARPSRASTTKVLLPLVKWTLWARLRCLR